MHAPYLPTYLPAYLQTTVELLRSRKNGREGSGPLRGSGKSSDVGERQMLLNLLEPPRLGRLPTSDRDQASYGKDEG